jgi:hypothetical protein
MSLNLKLPEISKQIYQEDVLDILENNYTIIGPHWIANQLEWVNGTYAAFKDHEKFLIVIYLIKKTLDFYSRNFLKLSYEQFYSKDKVEIERFNIIEISKNINIPKESARRKIIELEKSSIIIRNKKKITIDRSAYPFVKPLASIKRMSRFLSIFSKLLLKKKILQKEFTTDEIEKLITTNFSYVWKIYYELQIPMLLEYKKFFGDIETFHIFGTCVVNQHFSKQKKTLKASMNRADYINFMYSDTESNGINAMSISDITGIPRATVVRKLKILVKQKHLSIDRKKHYKLTNVSNNVSKLLAVQNTVFNQLSVFSTKVFNLSIL